MSLKRSFWFFLILAALGVVAIVWPIVANLGMQLKPENLGRAKARWQERGPADYDLDLTEKIDGDQTGDKFLIHVRGGAVTSVVSNGRSLTLDAVERDAYAVPGLFRRIEADLREEESSGSRRNYVSATFDPDYGYPARYVRKIRGSNSRVEWKVNLKVVDQ